MGRPKGSKNATPKPFVCKVCRAPLTDANWFAGQRRVGNRACIPCYRQKMLTWRTANPGRFRKNVQRWQAARRTQFLDLYGHKCACCGDTHSEFLAIDHVHNDGAAERLIRHQRTIINAVVNAGVPDPRYQLLCHNCHGAKSWYGACPHERER